MRIERLGLTRYGRFTDHSLDFGPKPGGADFHLVYGPNEAGKSTTLAAWLDLLYGIGAQSPYSFLHPYATMRIDAVLELGGAERRFSRIKRPQASLLDGADQPLPDAAILAELGGIGRDAYKAMFSLDEETLVAGGESILASRGDLGQLLFSASAGLAALTRRLDALKASAEAFHKPRAHKTGLAELKARLAALRDERAEIDTLAADHHRLVAEEAAADTAYREAVAKRGTVKARLERTQRILSALPRLDALTELLARRADLPELVALPPGLAEDLPRLQTLEVELATRSASLAEEAETLASEDAAIEEDPAALALADRFAALQETLGSRERSAAPDLPDRRQRLADARQAVATLLRRLGRPDEERPEALLIDTARTARLDELIDARSGIEAQLEAARSERETSAARLAEAEAAIAAGAGNASPLDAAVAAELRAILALIRGDDPEGGLARATAEARRSEARLGEAMALLVPFAGDAAALATMIAPGPATIADWRARRQRAEAALVQYSADTARLANEIARLTAETEALAARSSARVESEAEAARTARDAAWAAHRQRLDAASAERFELAMRRDDAAALARLAHVGDAARRAEIATSLAVTRAEAGRAATLRGEAEAELGRIDETICAAADAIAPGLAATAGLDGLEEWLRRRDKALEAFAAAREARDEVTAGEAAVGSATARLADALARAGDSSEGLTLAALVAHAEDRLARWSEQNADRQRLDERRREHQQRLAALKDAEARDAAWQADWQAALAATWLGSAPVPPTPRIVRDSLTVLGELAKAAENAASLADRIRKMEDDRSAYAAAIRALAAELGLSGDVDVGALAARITARIAAAGMAARKRAELDARLARHREAGARLAAQQEVRSRQISAVTGVLGVATLGQAAALLARLADRQRLEADIEAARRDIRALLDAPSFEEAEAVLAAIDREALAAERPALEQESEGLDQRCRELFAAKSKAEDRLAAIGGDGRVAAIEAARRTVLVEIEEGALAFLRLTAGIAAAETAIRLYRERHRSAMMTRASDAFRTISRGAYSGLAAEPAKDGERLIALIAGGGSREASELSKGTRFQLYLALRVAGYHEFAAGGRSVPFIADDIMESFDDFRAEEAFRLFAGMAAVGQVIYLTHHRHLIPIAQAVCPEVRIHRLEQAATGEVVDALAS
ncbi:AAA family ATPase [Kaistia geumhonensis]|uniref:Uncharacterized protein YhaN n=1 Tax=Kaistia geumhonensis TaxID=410839 RepID=A0ABU0M7W1_9HYPH|nr:AAA family ATPase [Kaistia geumhonensis]MCX5477742.1 AAA family ATPase [Kaistia geumhonensis]MDQ0517047.1 uncharacterized protein YhaN [Kaistia geumhonensis]